MSSRENRATFFIVSQHVERVWIVLGRDAPSKLAEDSRGRRIARLVARVIAAIGMMVVDGRGQTATAPAVEQVRRELREWADRPPGPGRIDELLSVALAQHRAGDPAGARASFQRALAKETDRRKLLEIARVQAKIGDREGSLRTLLLACNPPPAGPDASEPRPPDYHILIDIASEQSRLGDRLVADSTLRRAIKAAESLDPREKGPAVAYVIAARAEVLGLDAALDDVAAIADREHRFQAITGLRIRDDLGNIPVVERFLRMCYAEGIPPGRAEEDLVRAKARVNRSKLHALISIARTQSAAQDRAGAAETWRRARQVAESIDKEDDRDWAITQVARAMVKAGNAAEAWRLAKQIADVEHSQDAMVVIAEAHDEIGDPANPRAWDEAFRAAVDDTETVRILLRTAMAQIKAGDRPSALRTLDRALTTVRRMDPDEVRFGRLLGMDDTLNGIAKWRAVAGDIAGAIRLAGTIEGVQTRGDALAKIAAVQADAGDIPGALKTVGTIRRPTPDEELITHMRLPEDSLLEIIRIQARAGDVAGAMATIARMDRPAVWRPSALLQIAQGLDERAEAAKHPQTPRKP